MKQEEIKEMINKVFNIVEVVLGIQIEDSNFVIPENNESDIRKTEIIMKIEEEFDINISDQETGRIKSIRDLTNLVMKILQKKQIS